MSFGAFNKKSTTLQTSNTKSTGVAFSEVSGAAASTNIDGNNNTQTTNILDGGAIRDAFGFASASGGQAYDFAKAALKDSMGIAGEIVAESSALTANVAAKAVQDESDKIAELVKWMVGGLVIVGAAMMMKRGRA